MMIAQLNQTKLNEIVQPIVRKAKVRPISDYLPPSYRVSIAHALAEHVRDKTLQKQKNDGASKGGACAGARPRAGEKHRDHTQTGRSMLARLVGWKSPPIHQQK
jgi:hypothetical protein